MNQKGEGASKYKNILINRFKSTDDYPQGIFFDIKNIKSKKYGVQIIVQTTENIR